MKDKKVLLERIAKRKEKIERLKSNIVKLTAKREKIEATEFDDASMKRLELSMVNGDIEDKESKIVSLQEEIAKYDKEVQEINAIETKNRNVEPILKFLEAWKEHQRDWFRNVFAYYQKRKEEIKAMKNLYWKLDRNDPERAKIKKESDRFWLAVNPILSFVNDEDKESESLNWERIESKLQWDADSMYDRLLEQIEDITGEITDAGGLDIGEKGELNGYIIGKKGKASVQTIGAGGYNIQRFHFRTLVHEYK